MPQSEQGTGIEFEVHPEHQPDVTERSLNPKLEQQIAQQAGVKGVSDLFGDSLGPEGSEGDTYLTMMQYNTQTIVDALK